MLRRRRPLLGVFIVVAAVTVPASPTRTLVADASGIAVAGAAAGVQGVTLAPVDFDGDHRTDWAVVRNTGGGPAGQLTWYSLTQTGVITVTAWGLAGDFVVPGDYDGDGRADLAVWRPGSPGTFYVRRSTDGSLLVQTLGETGDDPTVVGDYDGDGRADFAVYRQGTTPGAQSRWFWVRSSDGQSGARAWGLHGDVPAPGDYDGDRVADFGVRRDSGSPQAVFYLQQSTAGFRTVTFGFPSDTVVPGDYDADGRTDIAVTRVASGQLEWYALRSSDSTIQSLTWGVTADLAVPGDYDGDGRTDAAVWRASADPAANRFWVLATGGGALVQQWGLQHDYPVANFNARGSSTPAITSAGGATFTVGTPGSFTVTTTGFPRPAIVQTGALPKGVTFVDHGDGSATLAGTPGTGASGPFPLTLQASNAAGTSPVQNFVLTVLEPPAITSAAEATFTAGQAGVFTVTASGSPAPTIALGGVPLPSGVTFVDHLDGTATLSGTPASGTGGVYPLVFTASNAAGSTSPHTMTLTVNAAPVITSGTAATFASGQAGSFTVSTTGFPTNEAMAISETGGLPSGVTFTDNGDGTATLAGTPAAGAGGLYPIAITAANGVAPGAAQNFTLTVHQAPAITSASSATFTVGAAGTFAVATTGFPTGASMAIAAAGALPAGVTFGDNGDGTATLGGTPAAGTGGTYPITITANNGVAPNGTQNFALTVNQAPAITSANATTFTVGSGGTFTVTTTGFPAAASMAIGQTGALPSGVTLVDNGDGTATLSGTPAPGAGGTYPITITADNGVMPGGTQNFTLTVHQAPAVTSASGAAFVVGVAGSFTVTTSGFPSPTIARGGAALPSGVTFVDNLNGTGTLSGTPGASTAGTYAISFTATNSVGTAPGQGFTLTVHELPAAGSDSPGTIDANTGLSGLGSGSTNLLFNDSPGSPAAALVSFGGGSLGGTPASVAAGATAAPLPGFGSGSLVVNADGSYTFVAPAGFTGVFTFQYRLTNAAGDSDGTVTINVRPVAAADVFAPVVIGNVAIDIAASVITANDIANPAITPIVMSGSSAAGGQVSAAGGVFRYDPPAGYEGADSFSYAITDGSGFTSAPATVSLTVGGMIWFIDNAAAANGDGRQSAPFNSLQNFVAVNDGVGIHPSDNQSVFLYKRPTPYFVTSSPLILRTGQRLIGQDHLTQSLATLAGVTVPAGSTLPGMHSGATVVASTIELRGFVQIHGLTVSTGTLPGIVDPAGVIGGMVTSDVTVETTTGIAIDLSDAAGNFSFRSVSADGALHGIRLVNTSGTFSVTGSSSGLCGGEVNTGTDPYTVTAPDVADCTGGTIQNTTSNGIRLINADTIDLSHVRILNTTGSGIKGSENIENFFFTYGYIDGSYDDGVDPHIANIAFNDDVTGTETNVSDQVTIQRSTFKNGLHHAIDIVNYAGTINSMSVTFNVYTSGTVGGPAGTSRGSGVRLRARGTATTATTMTRVVLTNSVYTNFPSGSAIEIITGNPDPAGPPTLFGTPGSAQTASAIVIGNDRMRGDSLANPMQNAVIARVEGRGQANIHIFGHGTAMQPVMNIAGDVIVHTVRGDATVTSFLQNNFITAKHATDAGDPVGIRVAAGEFAGLGTATLTAEITGNTVSQTGGSGIVASAAEGEATLHARLSGNTVAAPIGLGTANGIVVSSGSASGTDNAVCLDIFGNTSSGQNGAAGIGLYKYGTAPTTHDFGIEGLAATASPDVEAFVAGLNAAGGGVALLSGTSGFSGCGTAPRSGLASGGRSGASRARLGTGSLAPRRVARPVF